MQKKPHNNHTIINTLIIPSHLVSGVDLSRDHSADFDNKPLPQSPPKKHQTEGQTCSRRLLRFRLKLWDVSPPPLPPPLALLPPAAAAAAAPPGAAAALRGRHDPAGGGLLKAPHPLLHPSAPPGCSANHGHAPNHFPHPSSPKNTLINKAWHSSLDCHPKHFVGSRMSPDGRQKQNKAGEGFNIRLSTTSCLNTQLLLE